MKRFYKEVSTAALTNGGWQILLDGRPVRTPGKFLLTAPTQAMAQALRQEWDAQSETIQPRTMPLTTLLTTCIERTIPDRLAITESVLAYLNGDLLCYRAPEDDTGLAAEQEKLWGPWLTWFAGHFGHTLHTTTSLVVVEQPDNAHQAISTHINTITDHEFNILQIATAVTGSIVLALAITQNAITPDEAYQCILCEELFYERKHRLEQHGLDPIEEKRRAGLLEDLNACRHYLALLPRSARF